MVSQVFRYDDQSIVFYAEPVVLYFAGRIVELLG